MTDFLGGGILLLWILSLVGTLLFSLRPSWLARRAWLGLAAVLACILLLYPLHAYATLRFVSRLASPPQAPPVIYPGLLAYLQLTLGLTAGVGAVALALSWTVHATLASLAPLALGLLYWKVVLPVPTVTAPAGTSVLIDPLPLLWLTVYTSLGALVVLGTGLQIERRRRHLRRAAATPSAPAARPAPRSRS